VVTERLDMLSEEVVTHASVKRGREDFRAAAEDEGLGMFGGKRLGILGNGGGMGGGRKLLQSTQFFVFIPPPNAYSTSRTSSTNHTGTPDSIPNGITPVDASQSTHTSATNHVHSGDTSNPDHMAYSYAPPFVHGILHRAYCTSYRSRYKQRWR